MKNGMEVMDEWRYHKNQYRNITDTTIYDFQHYSRHDVSHSISILEVIEMILGEKRIVRLSRGDLWLLLEAAYSHDLGMSRTGKEMSDLWEDKGFKDYLLDNLQREGTELQEATSYYMQMNNILHKKAQMSGLEGTKVEAVAFEECWPDLDRDDKADIVMRYIDDIELEEINNMYVVKKVNFRSTFYEDFKMLFNQGYIDCKREMIIDFNGIQTSVPVRYSEFTSIKDIMQNFYRLNECYEVNLYKGTYYKETEKLDIGPLQRNEVPIRVFPLQKDNDNELLSMGMLVTKDSPNDIKVNIKQLGKKKNKIADVPFPLQNTPHTVAELIIESVRVCVGEYNSRVDKGETTVPLSNESINDMSEIGKIAFGINYGEKRADETKAIENALQSYEDGLYRIFIGDNEVGTLSDSIDLNENDSVTFIRLTMLTGRMW